MPARGGGRAPRRQAARRDDRRDQARGDRGRAGRRAAFARGTAARAGPGPSGRWSRSSTAAAPTRSTGTCPTPTTSGTTPPRTQVERYLRPALRGEAKDAYAVTERDAGSDPSADRGDRGARRDAGFRINAEKWFVTSGDVATVHRRDGERDRRRREAADPLRRRPRPPGVEIVDDPDFTHSYPDRHPTIRFTDVEVGADDVIGGDRRRRGAAALLVQRGAPRRSPRAGSARCGGCSTRPSSGRPTASRAAAGSSTTRGSPSRSRTRPPTPPPDGC